MSKVWRNQNLKHKHIFTIYTCQKSEMRIGERRKTEKYLKQEGGVVLFFYTLSEILCHKSWGMRKESKFRLWKTLEVVVVGVVLVGLEEAVGEREERREKASTIWHSVFFFSFPYWLWLFWRLKGPTFMLSGENRGRGKYKKIFIERKKPNTKANRLCMYIVHMYLSLFLNP